MGGFGYDDIVKDDYSYMNSLIEDVNAGKQILLTNKKRSNLIKIKLNHSLNL